MHERDRRDSRPPAYRFRDWLSRIGLLPPADYGHPATRWVLPMPPAPPPPPPRRPAPDPVRAGVDGLKAALGVLEKVAPQEARAALASLNKEVAEFERVARKRGE